jgi:hypothetical protein
MSTAADGNVRNWHQNFAKWVRLTVNLKLTVRRFGNNLSCAHNGRLQVVLIRDNMLGLSISELDWYLVSPVVFLTFFAIRARITSGRLSHNTRMVQRTNAPANLEIISEETTKIVISLGTNMTCTHCTHRHPRCGLEAIRPPNTDPRPVENIDVNASRDIGTPRLENCQ